MCRVNLGLWLFLVSLLVVPASAAQDPTGDPQPSVVTAADLDQALAERVSRADRSREAVLGLLRRPEIRRMAEGVGLDLQRAEAAVGSLEDQDIEWLAGAAAQVESDLSGGVPPQPGTGQYMPILYGLALVVLILVLIFA